MKFTTPFVLLGLSALAQAQTLPACSSNSTLPCKCPSGTNYVESGTFLISGVNHVPIQSYMGDFFNTTWLKRPIVSTKGTTNTAGAERTTRVSTKYGTVDVTETLTQFGLGPDGSWKMLYQLTKPVKVGKGTLGGWWVNLQAEAAFPDQTPMRWSLYGCESGHPIDFEKFQEDRWNEMIKFYKKQGLSTGDTLGPLSFQNF